MKLTIILLFISSIFSFSQTKYLEGKIVTVDSLSPIGNVTIYSLPDSSLVKGDFIDTSEFSVPFVAKEEMYYARFEILGYHEKLVEFKADKEVNSLGFINLEIKSLDEVNIVLQEPTYERTRLPFPIGRSLRKETIDEGLLLNTSSHHTS